MHRGTLALARSKRALFDLCVSLGIAALLAVLNFAITFSDRVNDYLCMSRKIPLTQVLINLLIVWLLVQLVLAFDRWRTVSSSRTELEAIVSSISPDVLLVVLPNRDITMCTKSIERMFGYRPEEVVGSKSELLYFDRRVSRERPHEIYEALEKQGFHIGEAQGKRRNGETFPLEIIAGEISGRSGAVLLLRDITERKQEAARREQLERRIQMQQKTESLGLLAAGVAHDFKNLLTIIQGNAELLKRGDTIDQETEQSLEAILGASGRATALCRQMLAYAGDAEFSIEPLNITEIVSRTCRLVGISLGSRVSLHCHLDDKLPVVRGDATQIQQVVMNLLLNASEAIGDEAGHITVRTAVREIKEEALAFGCVNDHLPTAMYVCLDVKDTGSGIDENVQSRIFDPFFSTKEEGRGLGLASVIGIVRAHKGTLLVESEPGRGTIFTVVFPCERTEAPIASPEKV